ncbi:MAG TPA: alpha/beta hydrolase, partial [Candidatus Elarobacter sp.]|nr:alpha/beta hydrolase [Candidatus Elarobacter sp.]
MIRTLFAASALLLASSGLAEAAGALDGHWDGAISRLGAIQRIRLDVVTDPSGAIHGTYDIPDLWLYGEPLTEVSLAGDDLTFHVLYGKFAGKLHGTVDELTGVNTAWDPPVGINLKRTPPIPEYRVRELRVAGKTTIAGSLYLPVSCTSCATVIVVPGSGDQSRATWSYRGYAAELARHGVAAFVYDKRGLGGSNGRWQTASFADLADDVAAIAQHL